MKRLLVLMLLAVSVNAAESNSTWQLIDWKQMAKQQPAVHQALADQASLSEISRLDTKEISRLHVLLVQQDDAQLAECLSKSWDGQEAYLTELQPIFAKKYGIFRLIIKPRGCAINYLPDQRKGTLFKLYARALIAIAQQIQNPADDYVHDLLNVTLSAKRGQGLNYADALEFNSAYFITTTQTACSSPDPIICAARHNSCAAVMALAQQPTYAMSNEYTANHLIDASCYNPIALEALRFLFQQKVLAVENMQSVIISKAPHLPHVISFLLDLGFEPNTKYGDVTLLCMTRSPEVVQLLVQHGAKINLENSYRRTPLENALYDLLGLGTPPCKIPGRETIKKPLADKIKECMPYIRSLIQHGARIDKATSLLESKIKGKLIELRLLRKQPAIEECQEEIFAYRQLLANVNEITTMYKKR